MFSLLENSLRASGLGCRPAESGAATTRSSSTDSLTLLLLGLDAAGKSALAARWQGRSDLAGLAPTVGYAQSQLRLRRQPAVTLIDVGGEARIRDIWPQYYSECHGLVFVLSAMQVHRWQEAKLQLWAALRHPNLCGKPLLLLVNVFASAGQGHATSPATVQPASGHHHHHHAQSTIERSSSEAATSDNGPNEKSPDAAEHQPQVVDGQQLQDQVKAALDLEALSQLPDGPSAIHIAAVNIMGRRSRQRRPAAALRRPLAWLLQEIASQYAKLEPRRQKDMAAKAEADAAERAAKRERVRLQREAREKAEAEAEAEAEQSAEQPPGAVEERKAKPADAPTDQKLSEPVPVATAAAVPLSPVRASLISDGGAEFDSTAIYAVPRRKGEGHSALSTMLRPGRVSSAWTAASDGPSEEELALAWYSARMQLQARDPSSSSLKGFERAGMLGAVRECWRCIQQQADKGRRFNMAKLAAAAHVGWSSVARKLWDVASYGTKPPGVARGADGRWPRAAFATAEAYDVYQERMSRAFSFSENLAESLRKDYTTGAEVLLHKFLALKPLLRSMPVAHRDQDLFRRLKNMRLIEMGDLNSSSMA